MKDHLEILKYVAAGLLVALLLQAWPLTAQAQTPSSSITGNGGVRHMRVSLELENPAPTPGTETTLALHMQPDVGWHGYWKVPGDAGFPSSVQWQLPPGAVVGELQYPVPHTLLMLGLMNHVYKGPYALLAKLDIPADAQPGSRLLIGADMRYLVCSDSVCLPETAQVAATLTVGGEVKSPEAANQSRFDAWRQALPRPLDAASYFEFKDGQFRLGVPLPAAVKVQQPHLYPTTGSAFAFAATQSFSRNGDTLVIEAPAGPGGLQDFDGVLTLGDGTGLALNALPGTVPLNGMALTPASTSQTQPLHSTNSWRTTLLALFGAVAGGLLLNVMPCVFPILSLKVLSLTSVTDDGSGARRESLAYTAGAVLVCLALGAALLGLRAMGSEIGWAFQLQSPAVILVLLLLTSAIGLNMAGLFELGSVTAGSALAEQGGVKGAFWTGGLAAFVATPCTGPFMAGALGAAMMLPPLAGLLVFAGLGFGLAMPFLVLGFMPALRQRLPKPGAWMQQLRRVLAVPMFATTLWLTWILGRQSGADGAVLGMAAAVLLGLGLWATGLRQHNFKRLSWWPAGVALALALGSTGLLPEAGDAATADTGTTRKSAKVTGEPFDQNRLISLQAEGKPVFLYFTADWCLTCKVNERMAIDQQDTQRAFTAAGVVTMVGDWTNGNAEIGRFISEHGRSGVPFYLWLKTDGSTEILPQLLTPSMLQKLANDA